MFNEMQFLTDEYLLGLVVAYKISRLKTNSKLPSNRGPGALLATSLTPFGWASPRNYGMALTLSFVIIVVGLSIRLDI